MLKETTEDIMIEQGVDIPHYVITKSVNQLLQPVLHQRPISYKEFKVGTLHHVYGNIYGFCISLPYSKVPLVYKRKTTDTETVSFNEETVFPLFKKEDIIGDLPTNLTFYLNPQKKGEIAPVLIDYYKLKMPCDLNSDGTVRPADVQECMTGPVLKDVSMESDIGLDIPIVISVFYEAYSGSLTLRSKLVGQDININESIKLGAQMHLSRF